MYDLQHLQLYITSRMKFFTQMIMSYEERYLSRKEMWITRIGFLFFALIISSIGPILTLTDTLYKYQRLVYHYNKYDDIPGPSELHVINVDLDMLKYGNVSMYCKGPITSFPRC